MGFEGKMSYFSLDGLPSQLPLSQCSKSQLCFCEQVFSYLLETITLS